MRRRRLLSGLLTLVLTGSLAGCTASPAAPPYAPTTVAPSGSATRPATPPPVHLPPLPARPSPTMPLAIGVRKLDLARGPDRPLPTTVWYPATGSPDGVTHPGATPATGRFPLVLLSHGLMGRPEALAPMGIRWAAAGFIVAAPAYPHTNHDTAHFDFLDVVNQPADASYVISQVLALDGHDGDLLAGHIDTAAVAATGHSAGGITTTGMLSTQRDPRLRAAIVLAGAMLGGSYTGPVTPVLFVHGDADQTVTYQGGRAAYNEDPWPKGFLTVIGGDHGSYLAAGEPGFNQMIEATTDFLRWTLYGDVAARGRLGSDGAAAGTTRWESTF